MERTSQAVFKIFTGEQWEAFQRCGTFEGSPDDRRDGFIHLSFREQIAGTLAKHFRGQLDLVVAEMNSEKLGDALRLEPSRGGALFPHLFRALQVDEVVRHEPASAFFE